MADSSKFEKMLELLINEDKEAAQELFHELVVEKSRDIYESLLEDEEEVEETEDEEVDESDDEEVDESDEDLDEGFDLDEFEVEADPMDMGGDPSDDMMMDLEPGDDEDDMDMDMDDEGDMDMDDEEGDMDMDMDDEGEMDNDDEEEKESFHFESDDEEVDESEDDLDEVMKKKDDKEDKKSAAEEMREYVEKIGGDRYDAFGKMGDNGDNTNSPVAGKNDMGGTTQNILRSDTAETGEANKGALKGSPISDTSPKDMNTKNINVPGGKASKAQKKQSGGGLDNNSVLKKDATDGGAKSPINGVKTRAK